MFVLPQRCRSKSFAVVIGVASLVLGSPLVVADASKPAPLPIEQMRAVAYTKAFAKRFALPDPEPGMEPEGGIQAMEFGVEPGPLWLGESAGYGCKLYLYLDNKLPISYPEGKTGVHYLPSHPTRLMSPDSKRWSQWSEGDRRHFNERNGRYNRMTWLATSDYVWQKRGAAHGMFYEEYHRDLFPDLGYIKIDTGCIVYSWMDKVDTLQIWLKREGAKDYRKQLRTDPSDFLKLNIPEKFYRRIIEWKKQTAVHNRSLKKQSDPDLGSGR